MIFVQHPSIDWALPSLQRYSPWHHHLLPPRLRCVSSSARLTQSRVATEVPIPRVALAEALASLQALEDLQFFARPGRTPGHPDRRDGAGLFFEPFWRVADGPWKEDAMWSGI